MEVKIYETDPDIPEKYYALIDNGIAYFASIDRFDWAVDMLAEDGNENARIGLMEDGICTKTWSREEVLHPNIEEATEKTRLDVKFEVGKKYRVNGGQNNIIEVVKRTKFYVTVSGAFNGRYKVHTYRGPIGNEEVLLIYSGKYRENLSSCSALDEAK